MEVVYLTSGLLLYPLCAAPLLAQGQVHYLSHLGSRSVIAEDYILLHHLLAHHLVQLIKEHSKLFQGHTHAGLFSHLDQTLVVNFVEHPLNQIVTAVAPVVFELVKLLILTHCVFTFTLRRILLAFASQSWWRRIVPICCHGLLTCPESTSKAELLLAVSALA